MNLTKVFKNEEHTFWSLECSLSSVNFWISISISISNKLCLSWTILLEQWIWWPMFTLLFFHLILEVVVRTTNRIDATKMPIKRFLCAHVLIVSSDIKEQFLQMWIAQDHSTQSNLSPLWAGLCMLRSWHAKKKNKLKYGFHSYIPSTSTRHDSRTQTKSKKQNTPQLNG